MSTKDIEISRLKEELYRASASLDILMDTITYLIWIKDPLGCYIQVNQAYASFCGKPIEYLLGKTDVEIWGPDLLGKPFMENFIPKKVAAVNIEYQSVEHPILGRQHFKVILAPVVKVSKETNLFTIGIAVNITEQVDKERIAKATIEKIQHQLNKNKFIK